MDIFDFVKFSIKEEHKSVNKLLDELTEDLLQVPIGEDDSIGKRLMHMTSAEYSMAMYLFEKEGEVKKDYPLTIDGLRKSFAESEKRHLETIDSLTLDDLTKIYVSKRTGREFTYTWLLYHFIEHLSTHRGQITTVIKLAKT